MLWLEVVEAAAAYGLAALAGSSPDVGVVGYTLGGGVSFLGRKYRLAANNVRAIEVVTADGRVARVDRAHERDMFWALRGGGGSFGIVTAIELELIAISEVYAGILWFPIERGSEVLHAWREPTAGGLPDELTTVGRFPQLPRPRVDRGAVRDVCGRDRAGPRARSSGAFSGAGCPAGACAVGGGPHVPELRRDAASRSDVLHRAGLRAATSDQGRR